MGNQLLPAVDTSLALGQAGFQFTAHELIFAGPVQNLFSDHTPKIL